MSQPSQDELRAATAAVRRLVNETAYGGYVSDDLCRQVATAALKAAANVKEANHV